MFILLQVMILIAHGPPLYRMLLLYVYSDFTDLVYVLFHVMYFNSYNYIVTVDKYTTRDIFPSFTPLYLIFSYQPLFDAIVF